MTIESEPDSVAGTADVSVERWTVAPTAILEGLPDAVVVCGVDERITFVNRLAGELFGYAPGELVGEPVALLWPERLRDRYTRILRRRFAAEPARRFTTEASGRKRDGTEFVGEMNWGVVETATGPALLAVGRDITGRVETEARLRGLARLGERALAGADVATLSGEAVQLLHGTLPLSGAAVHAVGGAELAAAGAIAEPGLRVPIGAGDELRLGAQRELDPEELALVNAVVHTLQAAFARLRDEARVRHEAVHDALTGLPNRTLLQDRLTHAVAKSQRTAKSAAVLFVDLDNFKQINDAHGHRAGDAVLVELGRRLGNAVRPGDTIARFGGDEFVAICEDVDEAAAMMVGVRILEAVQHPFVTQGSTPHQVTASVGVALGRDDPDALLANADAAAYRAKANGRGRVELF